MNRPAPIAVIGVGFRLPGGANNLESLSELIQNGGSGHGTVPKDRWNHEAFYSAQPNTRNAISSQYGHFLRDDISKFDAPFFQIGRNEACSMDPKQRILLQTTYEALENAGIPLEQVRGTNTSVHVSTFTYDYERMGYRDTQDLSGSHVVGTGPAILSNRISYFFDLKGPSFTLDTGCSGGLIALHQACQVLRTGESSLAIAGGAQLIIDPDQSVNMNSLGMINTDGRCYAFDSRGDGYGRGEGIATLILKTFDKALTDGDHVHAVIVNSGINQDGKSTGSIMSPVGDAQRDLMRKVYSECGLDAADTPYVEAHGTGTKVGDQEEISSIYQVFTKDRQRTSDVIVGSVKANIGHLEASAGLAGLLKSIVVLQSGLVPPQLLFQQPKPGLDLDKRNIIIPTEAMRLPEGPSRASVNSFGYGGTNCHVIIESLDSYKQHSSSYTNGTKSLTNGHHTTASTNGNATSTLAGHSTKHDEIVLNGHQHGNEPEHRHQVPQKAELFIVSANSEQSLKASASRLQEWVAKANHHDLAVFKDLAHTLLTRRSLFTWRQCIVASDYDGLYKSLASPIATKTASQNHIAFTFTGQGAQWAGMGRELMEIPAFESSLLKSESFLSQAGCLWNLTEEIAADEKSSNLGRAELAQPVTTALQIALVDLLRSLDIRPSCVVGHSSGEIAAAYTNGVLSHQSAIKVAYERGLCALGAVKKAVTSGSMLAVGLGEAEIRKYLDLVKSGKICVACVNSPGSTTISGDETGIDELKTILDVESIFARKLKVDTAYHSHHMQIIADEYRASLEDVKPSVSQSDCAFFSTVTASRKETDFAADYWVRNLVSPVRFSEGLSLASKHLKESATTSDSLITLIEIGPAAVLAGPAKQVLNPMGLQYSYLSVLKRKENARLTLLNLLGQLLERGCELNRSAIVSMDRPEKLSLLGNLPTYPFDESSYWKESRASAAYRFRKFPYHDLCGLLDPACSLQEPRWRHVLTLDTIPWLRDHVIDGIAVFPASGYIAMVVEAAKQLWSIENRAGVIKSFLIENVTFSQAISFALDESKASTEIQLVLSPAAAGMRWQTFRFSSYDNEGQTWNENCVGKIVIEAEENVDAVEGLREQDFGIANQQAQLKMIEKEATQPLEQSVLYERLGASGNLYGPTFACLNDIRYGTNKGVAKLDMPDLGTLLSGYHMQPHVIHPACLDATLHIATLLSQEMCHNASIVVGKIHSMWISAGLMQKSRRELRVASSLTPQDRRTIINENFLFETIENEVSLPLLKAIYTFQAFKIVNAESATSASIQKPPLQVVYKPDAELQPVRKSDGCAIIRLTNTHAKQASRDSQHNGGETVEENTELLAQYLESFVFKYPQAKLLQIGAQLEVTSLLAKRLSKPGGGLWLDRYDVTDSEAASLKTIKAKLAALPKEIQIRKLDILQNPVEQGFDTLYDVVIIPMLPKPQSYSGTEATLRTCRNLLQAGGKLVWVQDGPEQNTEQQRGLLHQLDFCGYDLIPFPSIPGFADPVLTVTTASDSAAIAQEHSRTIKVIYKWNSNSAQAIFDDLQQRLGVEKGFTVSKAGFDELDLDSDTLHIVLDFAEHAYLLDDSKKTYQAMQRLLTSNLTTIWVSLRESSTAQASSISSLIQGASRVLRRENGGNGVLSVLQVDEEVAQVDMSRFCEQLARITELAMRASSQRLPALENEYVYREGTVLIPRLELDQKFSSWIDRRSGNTDAVADMPYHQDERPLQLEVAVPGLLSSMRFSDDKSAKDPLQPWEIQVSSRAHGVNFKDVFISLGQMPPTVRMVGEVAGIVTAVGADMQQRYRIGDHVMGFFAKPFASLPRFSGDLAHIIPQGMDFKTAATIPCTYATAYHCLFEVARFKKGQSILITAASGGVGQAAIQLAQYFGASEIFVTVGSESKKNLVMDNYDIPESHVFSSRRLTFQDGIHRMTNGRGVDVVINSLAGDLLQEAFKCVAKLGVFCEIGKGDIYNNGHLNMKPLDRSITFAAVDLTIVAEQKPEAIYDYLVAIAGLFEKEALRPVVPIIVFGMNEIENAFRLIAGRKHTGKVVLDSSEHTIVKSTLPPPARLELSKNAVYVVAGGLGAIGRHLTRFLALKGAGHVVLLSRRKVEAKACADLAKELSLPDSTKLHILQCDITSASQVLDCSEYCKKNIGTVRGIIHSAMLLRDRPFSNMSLGEFHAPLGPKVYGTLNLDKAFGSSSLDFFVMLASSATIIGNGSQANYAAANAFQDGFAKAHAKNSSTNYIALNLGAVEDTSAVGSVSKAQRNRLESISISIDETMRALEYAMSPQSYQDGCNQSVLGISRQALFEADDNFCLADPFFSRLTQAPQESNTAVQTKKSDVKEDIRAAKDLKQVHSLVRNALVERCSSFLDRNAAEIPLDSPLASIGFDSLVSIELKNWVIRTFEATVQTSQIASAPSIAALAVTIASRSKLVKDEVKSAESASNTMLPQNSVSSTNAVENGSKGSLEFQCCLENSPPKMPLSSLDDYLRAYKDSVSAFAYTDAEQDMVKKSIDEYRDPNGLVHALYQVLEKRAADSFSDAWIYSPDTPSLLAHFRQPLVPWNTFVHTHHDSEMDHSQAERAALISTTAFKFLQSMKKNEIEHDWLGSRPLCSYYWLWMFGSLREPQLGCDKMRMYPDSRHIAVFRKGHLFRIPLEIGDEPCTLGSMNAAFQSIIDLPLDERWEGIMTTDFRDTWAMNREKLLNANTQNANYFRCVEEATFVICLDDGNPVTNYDRVWQALLDDGSNRWFDKTTQFVVSANGRSAHLAEHTMVDGTTPLSLTEHLHDAIMSHDSSFHLQGDHPAVPVEELSLKTDSDIDTYIERLRLRYKKLTSKKSYCYFKTSLLSHSMAAGSNIAPKSCLDLAIQLAGRLHFGRNVATWEPVSMQHYHKGRPDIMQPLETHIARFCDAAADHNVSLATKKQLMQKAAEIWEERVQEHRDARGYVRRSEALLGILLKSNQKRKPLLDLSEEQIERWNWVDAFLALVPPNVDLPLMFNNPVFHRVYPGEMYHVLNEGEFVDASTFVMGENKIWISKRIRQSYVSLSVSGDVGDIDEFKESFEKAAYIIRDILLSE